MKIKSNKAIAIGVTSTLVLTILIAFMTQFGYGWRYVDSN